MAISPFLLRELRRCVTWVWPRLTLSPHGILVGVIAGSIVVCLVITAVVIVVIVCAKKKKRAQTTASAAETATKTVFLKVHDRKAPPHYLARSLD